MDFSGSADISNPLPSVAKLVDTGNNEEEEELDTRRRSNCAPPNKVNGSLVYRGDTNEPLLAAAGFGGSHQVGPKIGGRHNQLITRKREWWGFHGLLGRNL
jgi:hypothetical protein